MWVFAICEFQAINMLICNLQDCVSFGSGFMHDGSWARRDADLFSLSQLGRCKQLLRFCKSASKRLRLSIVSAL